ncbi:hypothetical protein NDU88_003807 [Pleurodeles waltl]|uniref:Uncharacterized protein n=1 Tax=Pleurodeles waltl TaxID=8319 RepID=A0AAV7UH59_PLEWA|nr:hypothetical protein NDU88_003807 [Pleurodeles waltl]
MRSIPDKKTGLSPQEILMGRVMRLPAVPANALVNLIDDMVLDYCKGLADVILLSLISRIHASHTREVINPTEQEEELLRLPPARHIPGEDRGGSELESEPEHTPVDLPTPVTDEVEGILEEEDETSSTSSNEKVKELVKRE